MDEQPPHQPPPPLTPPPIIYAPPPKRSGCSPVWRVLALVFLVLLCLSAFTWFLKASNVVAPRARGSEHRRLLEEFTIEQTNSDNKIAVITVNGVIMGGSVDHSEMNLVDYVSAQLKSAQRDSDVKAVILKVDSPGGEVLASDEINAAIRKFEDETHRPVVASMGALAASGGYYISVPCNWIVANELTITGSIGVIMDSWNYRHLMDKVGIRPEVFKSGRFKDMLSGSREPDSDKLSPEERKNREEEDAMVQSLINETYEKFKSIVKEGRGAAAEENMGQGHALVNNWQEYADGRVLSGKRAQELGFVDELGDFDTAVKRAEKLAHIGSASLVEYRVAVDFQYLLSHLFAKSETPALKVDLGFDPPRLQAGRMYYILPMAVLH